VTNGQNDEPHESTSSKSLTGYSLEYDAARKIAQGLGAHLEDLPHLVSVKGSTAMLLPVSQRTRYLLGRDSTVMSETKKKKKNSQQSLFDFNDEMKHLDEQSDRLSTISSDSQFTVLDQVHLTMILFAGGKSETMKRLLIEEGMGRNPLFWRLAQALSALYPSGTEEKRWVDGVMAKKKGLGF
jgi:putative DNA methylase